MENALQRKPDNAPVRDIGVITAEIKDLCGQARAMMLVYVVEIGRRLVEAKEVLPHGQWAEWLKTEVEFSQRTANNYMRLYEEYSTPQQSLFGAQVESQTFAKLPYSKALALIAIPDDEREEFAAEVHAEDLSVKELQAAIEARNKAQQLADERERLNKELNAKLAAAVKAAEEAKATTGEAESLRSQLEEMTARVQKERDAAAALKEKLEKAETDPKIPKETLDKLRTEAEQAAKKEAEANAQKALEAAKKKAEKATEEAIKARNAEAQARTELEEAQRKLKTASPEVAAFKALFDDMQSAAAKLRAMIEKIRSTDPETADKLSKALKAFGANL